MSLNRLPAVIKKVVIAGAASGAYSSGDQIGTPVEMKNAVFDSEGIATVMSVTLLDVAKQDQAVDVVFFSKAPSAGTDNAAWNPSVGDLAAILGVVKIPTTAYSDGSSLSAASVSNIGLKVKPEKLVAAGNSTSIWVLLVSRGTPNYGATAATLALRVGLNQD